MGSTSLLTLQMTFVCIRKVNTINEINNNIYKSQPKGYSISIPAHNLGISILYFCERDCLLKIQCQGRRLTNIELYRHYFQ